MSVICQQGLDKILRQNIFAPPAISAHAWENLLSIIVGRKMKMNIVGLWHCCTVALWNSPSIHRRSKKPISSHNPVLQKYSTNSNLTLPNICIILSKPRFTKHPAISCLVIWISNSTYGQEDYFAYYKIKLKFWYYLDIEWKIFDGDVAGRLEHSMTQPCHL